MGVQRRIFGPKNDTVFWDNLCAGVLHDLCHSPSDIKLIKMTKMRWTGHVARNGGGVMWTGFWWVNPRKDTTWKTWA